MNAVLMCLVLLWSSNDIQAEKRVKRDIGYDYDDGMSPADILYDYSNDILDEQRPRYSTKFSEAFQFHALVCNKPVINL